MTWQLICDGSLLWFQFDDKRARLDVAWSDGHLSSFDFDWLMQRNFSREAREAYICSSYQPSKTLWTKNDFNEVFAKFDFHSLLDSDKVLLDWLQHMATFGIALIENTPSTNSEVRKIAKRVGVLKATHYGDDFTVTSKEQTTAFAYKPTKLQLHVDLPTYEQMPGVNMLHCVTQSSSGGANTLVDGFYVAELLREQNPNYFQILSSVKVNWCDYGEESGIKHQVLFRAPVVW